MDYINGKIINNWDVIMIQKVAGFLDYLLAIRGIALRSLNGDFSRGIIFPDIKNIVFRDLESMES
jgi:hypothetical protein